MPIYTDEDVEHWTLEKKKEIHEWCFYKDYGDCDLCALNNLYGSDDEKMKEVSHGGMNNKKEVMTEQQINKRFAELAGICWHPRESIIRDLTDRLICRKCGQSIRLEQIDESNPDFTDAREVLKAIKDKDGFLTYLNRNYWLSQEEIIELFTNTTGKLRDLAIQWMEEKR